ncbi:hypothetical protein C8F01DRAFT_268577 [Mycena amicta]|nr:hypothetical protein C8F01DRAFT_268577 [Mycena amicta]
MSTTSSQSFPPLDGTLGTTEIGAILGTFLFGIAVLQMFLYYYNYPKDACAVKALVASVMLLELAHSISVWHGVYSMTVTFYGQIAHLLNPPHSLSISILFTALILPLVQTFYALRIRALSGRWTITVILTLLTISRLAFSILLMQIFLASSGFSVLQTKAHWVFTAVAALGPAVDLLTAASLCWLLYRMKEGTQPGAPSRRIVDTLIVWTVETTAITSLAGLFQLIFFLTREDLTWMTFYLLQPKLFSNSMLASLNNRTNIREMAGGVITLNAQDTHGGGVVIQMRRMTETNIDGEVDHLTGHPDFLKSEDRSANRMSDGTDGGHGRRHGSMRKSKSEH